MHNMYFVLRLKVVIISCCSFIVLYAYYVCCIHCIHSLLMFLVVCSSFLHRSASVGIHCSLFSVDFSIEIGNIIYFSLKVLLRIFMLFFHFVSQFEQPLQVRSIVGCARTHTTRTSEESHDKEEKSTARQRSRLDYSMNTHTYTHTHAHTKCTFIDKCKHIYRVRFAVLLLFIEIRCFRNIVPIAPLQLLQNCNNVLDMTQFE